MGDARDKDTTELLGELDQIYTTLRSGNVVVASDMLAKTIARLRNGIVISVVSAGRMMARMKPLERTTKPIPKRKEKPGQPTPRRRPAPRSYLQAMPQGRHGSRSHRSAQ